MNQQILMSLPGITAEEMLFIKEATKEFTEEQQNNFLTFYVGRRKDPQTIMLTAIIGLLGVAGVHRFLLNQTGMGVLYFFTAGLCFVGTIVDLINYQKLTLEFNQKMIVETVQITRSMH